MLRPLTDEVLYMPYQPHPVRTFAHRTRQNSCAIDLQIRSQQQSSCHDYTIPRLSSSTFSGKFLSLGTLSSTDTFILKVESSLVRPLCRWLTSSLRSFFSEEPPTLPTISSP